MRKALLLVFILNSFCEAQGNLTFELRMLADININKFSDFTNFRVNTGFNYKYNLGYKKQIFINLSPNFNLMIFRGLGGSINDSGRKLFRPNIVLSAMVGYEFNDKNPNPEITHRVVPFTFLNNMGFRSYKNYVFALGTNHVMFDFKEKRNQCVGSGFIGIRNYEFSYSNDGPPFSKWLGDGQDRYFTGSGFMGWVCPQWKVANETATIRLSFDRYTGYKPNAYEIANFMKMDFIPYANPFVNLYNRGTTRLGVFTDSNSAELSLNDTELFDVQYWIHKVRGFSLHRTANEPSVSLQFSHRKGFDLLNNSSK